MQAGEAAGNAAPGARRANQVLFGDTTGETNPEVLAATARLDQARVDLSRAVIRAPVDGVVDQRHFAVGQRLQPGVPIMVVVPVQNMYVDRTEEDTSELQSLMRISYAVFCLKNKKLLEINKNRRTNR